VFPSLVYQGFTGSVSFSAEDGVFYGKVLDVPALISYEGATLDDLIRDFCLAVDDYLSLQHPQS